MKAGSIELWLSFPTKIRKMEFEDFFSQGEIPKPNWDFLHRWVNRPFLIKLPVHPSRLRPFRTKLIHIQVQWKENTPVSSACWLLHYTPLRNLFVWTGSIFTEIQTGSFATCCGCQTLTKGHTTLSIRHCWHTTLEFAQKKFVTHETGGCLPFLKLEILVGWLAYRHELAKIVFNISCFYSSHHVMQRYQVFHVCFKLQINTNRLNVERRFYFHCS